MISLLLTGGTGFIGSHVAVVLAQLGHRIVLFDNLSNSRSDVVDKLARISGQNMPLVVGDVRDTSLLTETLNKYKVSGVIHFAGLKAVGESVANPVDYYANNVQGAVSLLEAMRTTSVRTLVFSSSATVYGHSEYLPLDEDHPIRATNPYGRSKIHVEEILADLVRSDATWRIACLRYFNPVGAHESGLIGEKWNEVPNNLMPYIAQVATGQQPELKVFGNDYPTPDGTGVRDYIHVMDLAEGHVAALNYLHTNTGWQAFNLGTGQGFSVLEVVHAFEKASGREVPYRIEPRRSGDVAECYADAQKAGKLLKWIARRTLHESCASTWLFRIKNDNQSGADIEQAGLNR